MLAAIALVTGYLWYEYSYLNGHADRLARDLCANTQTIEVLDGDRWALLLSKRQEERLTQPGLWDIEGRNRRTYPIEGTDRAWTYAFEGWNRGVHVINVRSPTATSHSPASFIFGQGFPHFHCVMDTPSAARDVLYGP